MMSSSNNATPIPTSERDAILQDLQAANRRAAFWETRADELQARVTVADGAIERLRGVHRDTLDKLQRADASLAVATALIECIRQAAAVPDEETKRLLALGRHVTRLTPGYAIMNHHGICLTLEIDTDAALAGKS
jgi:hypothetical protein